MRKAVVTSGRKCKMHDDDYDDSDDGFGNSSDDLMELEDDIDWIEAD